jgi:chemotaxis protein CheD
MSLAHSPPPANASPPRVLPQFAHVRRYWDPVHNTFAAKLLPGEYYVTTSGEMLCTVLGSCVSACVRDRTLGLGGMNHFMLPLDLSRGEGGWAGASSAATRYGNVAMERLIGEMLKAGARRANLEFKLVGGGKVLAAMTDVGLANIQFVRAYMKAEGLEVSGEDLGDVYPRKVHFYPDSGRVRVQKLLSTRNNTIYVREQAYLQEVNRVPPPAAAGLSRERVT